MTNYIIENNIDFFSELNKNSDDKDDNINNLCLLTHEKLTFNYVTLPCGHKFNYGPIYNEVCKQKMKIHIFNSKDIIKLAHNQIKCPYCRKKSNKLLPYIPLDNYKKKIKGVNSPICDTQPGKYCQYIMKNGKNFGKACYKNAYENELGCFCSSHMKKVTNEHNKKECKKEKQKETKKSKKQDTQTINPSIKITPKLTETELNKKTVVMLKNMLRENSLRLVGNKKELVARVLAHM